MYITLVLEFFFIILVLYKLLLSNDKKFDWKKYGVREIDTSPALGRLDFILGRKPLIASDDYAYAKMGSNDKYCGIVQMGKPLLLIKDPELIKKVLIKDYEYFLDRRQVFTSADGPLQQMLPNLEGAVWKGVRTSVSPTFSSGKLRRMIEHFNEIGLEWAEELTHKAQMQSTNSLVINVRDIVNQYTIEVISNTVFGMKANAIKNPESVFAIMASRATQFNKLQLFKLGIRLNFPNLSRFLGFSIVHRKSLAFFERILQQALKSRMNGEHQRNDFLQLLVEAKKKEEDEAGNDGTASFLNENEASSGPRRKDYYLTEEIMNAQSVVFFFAGYNTTNHLITFTLYALALYPSIQTRLRQEVEKIAKQDGSFDYDDITQLIYLDMVICEVLRKFPSGRLERVCSKEYRDVATELVIPKGMVVGIPVNGIHNDRKHYNNPDDFDPEHFSPENKAKRSTYAFMPFGIGARNCIGMRFAQIVVKSAIAYVIHKFIVEPTENTPVPMKGVPTALQLVPPRDLELKLTPVNQQQDSA